MFTLEAHPPREQLALFLAGRLSDADLAAVASHVQDCGACAQTLRDIPDDELAARLRGMAAPDDESDPHLPRELLDHPRYALGRFLGRGGMGVVYQAEHRLMNRQVALKIIHRELSKHPRVIDRFRQEVKAAARLSHPNIVAAYDAEQAGDVHFLVMEYVDGVNLARLVARRGPIEPNLACHFIRQAAKGLHHAYLQGMVHRDIKPHNLMLTRKGTIKILDFGLARLASETKRGDLGLPVNEAQPGQTRAGEIMGTPEFMAPEQLTDPASADIRADIYGLGCTLYFLLAGESPFAHLRGRANLLSAKRGPARPIRELRHDLPAGLIDVIEKMMAPEPARRYATPADVVQALAPCAKSPPDAPAAKAAAPPEPPRVEPHTFAARCPFCQAAFRLPDKAQGASIPCPQCGSYFTAAPVESR